jgi:hypothetical protein
VSPAPLVNCYRGSAKVLKKFTKRDFPILNRVAHTTL